MKIGRPVRKKDGLNWVAVMVKINGFGYSLMVDWMEGGSERKDLIDWI